MGGGCGDASKAAQNEVRHGSMLEERQVEGRGRTPIELRERPDPMIEGNSKMKKSGTQRFSNNSPREKVIVICICKQPQGSSIASTIRNQKELPSILVDQAKSKCRRIAAQ